MMDWKDQKRTHQVTVQMVSPNSLDMVLGELEGVVLDASSVSAAYYTDTRTSAKIRVIGESWIPDSFLRIIVTTDGEERVLGTYRVYDVDAEEEAGTWSYDLTCQSMLYRISKDEGAGALIIKSGVTAMQAAAQDLDFAGATYEIDGNDALINSPIAFDSGANRLTQVMKLCTMADNRIDVNGYGVITISGYKEPSSMSPELTLDMADPRGVVHSGISRSTDRYSLENRVVVAYRANSGDSQNEIIGYADVEGNLSPATRGAVISDYRVVDSLNPPTAAAAFDLARKYAKSKAPSYEWDITTQYLPIWEGSVISLVVHDGAETGERVCLVKNLDMNLGDLTMKLKLKEVAHD